MVATGRQPNAIGEFCGESVRSLDASAIGAEPSDVAWLGVPTRRSLLLLTTLGVLLVLVGTVLGPEGLDVSVLQR